MTYLFVPIVLLVIYAREVFDLVGMDPDASRYAVENLQVYIFSFYIEMLVAINRQLLQNLGY